MPAENIKRAIQRGTGELPGVAYEEVTYEGYGPGGIALIIESVTDNRNRTVAEIRHLLEKYNGKLGATGSVAWMFHRKGVIRVPKAGQNEDDLLGIILDAGADDMKVDDDGFEIVTSLENFEPVRQTLEKKGIPMEEAEVQMIPENYIKVDGKEAESVLKLNEAIEDHEDTQHVYANFDIDDKVMASINME
jgi:YebC/PmpR family DNA-binding regulatory protein